MCGIFGFDMRKYQRTRGERIAMAAVLCALNDNRGGESWGYYDIINDSIKKGLGDIANVSSKVGRSTYFLGHTRKATTGDIIAENSHPFLIGNIIGAHNGMIMNHEELNAKYERKCIVDSEHLFHHINSGLDFEDISGYGAIEWVDKRHPNRVYLCRLGGGELSVFGFGEKRSNRGVLWSSDDDHAKCALSAGGITKYTEFKIETGVVFYVENGMLYKTEQTYALERSHSYGYGSLNQYGWYESDNSKGTGSLTGDALANYMDQKERGGSPRWKELYDLHEANRQKLEDARRAARQQELDGAFAESHALNGDDIDSGDDDEEEFELDTAMLEWYLENGGTREDYYDDMYLPTVVGGFKPTK